VREERSMKERIAIIEGLRSPMDKAGGKLRDVQADDLAAPILREVLIRAGVAGDEVDEVILGNVAQPAKAANISRVAALKAGVPVGVPAYTVHRNCASGMESITSAASRILSGESRAILAGGVESMSNIPFLFNRAMTRFFQSLQRAKTAREKLRTLSGFRPSFLRPEIGLLQGLTDPVTGLIMGMTAELLAREFRITRDDQDGYALESHRRAVKAIEEGAFEDEIVPLPLPPDFRQMLQRDSGPRENQTMEALAKLSPYFDRRNGTVTVGNSCPLTDGAAAVLLMGEQEAKKRGLGVLGYLRDYAYASLEPERMGLGPVFAFSRLMDKTGITMKDIELIELNEAFAAQVLADQRAFESESFARDRLSKSRAIGTLNLDIVNVHGGAIALGHPVGMTGTRLVIHLLRAMRKLGRNTGLATLCVGGGQGAALLLEVA
jgi:acetyl-CoA C-acetyltransferase/acetyl-CoA acyltransferase